MNFKNFLSEALEPKDIFAFYALGYIVTAGNTAFMEPYEIDRAYQLYASYKARMWREIMAEGIHALASEARYFDPDKGVVLPQNDPEYLVTTTLSYDERANITQLFYAIKWDSAYSATNMLLQPVQIFGSMDRFFTTLITVFEHIGWINGYGGEAWAEIAKELYKFWKKGEDKVTTIDIDHILDLAHNNDTWTDKFVNAREVIGALDDKRYAYTPHNFKSEIDDPEIRKLLGKSLLTVDKISKINSKLFYYDMYNGHPGNAASYLGNRIPSKIMYFTKTWPYLIVDWQLVCKPESAMPADFVGRRIPNKIVRFAFLPIISGTHSETNYVNFKWICCAVALCSTESQIPLMVFKDSPLYSIRKGIYVQVEDMAKSINNYWDTSIKPQLESKLLSVIEDNKDAIWDSNVAVHLKKGGLGSLHVGLFDVSSKAPFFKEFVDKFINTLDTIN